MKFDMGSTTLSTLSSGTQSSHQDLGVLVTDLVRSAEPLEGSFNGAGRVAFDRFKESADDVAADLNRALAAIVQGQAGMDLAFRTGDEEAGDNAAQAQGRVDFTSARFSARA